MKFNYNPSGIINLRGHRFLMYSETLKDIENLINDLKKEDFYMNDDGKSWKYSI